MLAQSVLRPDPTLPHVKVLALGQPAARGLDSSRAHGDYCHCNLGAEQSESKGSQPSAHLITFEGHTSQVGLTGQNVAFPFPPGAFLAVCIRIYTNSIRYHDAESQRSDALSERNKPNVEPADGRWQ